MDFSIAVTQSKSPRFESGTRGLVFSPSTVHPGVDSLSADMMMAEIVTYNRRKYTENHR